MYWVTLTLAVMAKCFYFLDTLPDSTTGTFEENNPLERPSHMSEDNIKMNLRCTNQDKDWVCLAPRFLVSGLPGALSWVARQLAH